MFEHFRSWFKDSRNVKTVGLIFGFIVFMIVLKHFNLYEGFFDAAQQPQMPSQPQQPQQPQMPSQPQQPFTTLENFGKFAPLNIF
jgi:hypothetical protein